MNQDDDCTIGDRFPFTSAGLHAVCLYRCPGSECDSGDRVEGHWGGVKGPPGGPQEEGGGHLREEQPVPAPPLHPGQHHRQCSGLSLEETRLGQVITRLSP